MVAPSEARRKDFDDRMRTRSLLPFLASFVANDVINETFSFPFFFLFSGEFIKRRLRLRLRSDPLPTSIFRVHWAENAD